MTQKGERVMTVSHSDGDRVFVFGEGVYVGNEPVGEEAAGVWAALARDAGAPNPKIELDCGKSVWGCECWWGPVEAAKSRLTGMEIVTIDIEEVRQRVNSTGR